MNTHTPPLPLYSSALRLSSSNILFISCICHDVGVQASQVHSLGGPGSVSSGCCNEDHGHGSSVWRQGAREQGATGWGSGRALLVPSSHCAPTCGERPAPLSCSNPLLTPHLLIRPQSGLRCHHEIWGNTACRPGQLCTSWGTLGSYPTFLGLRLSSTKTIMCLHEEHGGLYPTYYTQSTEANIRCCCH